MTAMQFAQMHDHVRPAPLVSVLMPTYNRAAFIGRAIESLHAQSFTAWELVIVDDGSTDHTLSVLEEFTDDPRITLVCLPQNLGLGAALNRALAEARAPLIAYLPDDDVYHREHLLSLLDALSKRRDAIAAYSGVRHRYNREAPGVIEGEPLQLVQVLHRRTRDRWTERDELVSDDHERLYWHKLRARGEFIETGRVTCEWGDHPHQLSKLIRESVGGINPFRQAFGLTHPLRFHSTCGNLIDEVATYAADRARPATPAAPDALKILLVGELAYNADRVLALEALGHRLYGLWMREPYWYNTVGPLPFGHVQDLPHENWRAALAQLQPDVIYAGLNWQAVQFAHEVLRHVRDADLGIPFVWHFKEGPFICREKGTWREMAALYREADGRIYCSEAMADWTEHALPLLPARPTMVLDGDLPRASWFGQPPSPRIAAAPGEFHTVVPGRPIGLHPHTVAELASLGIHLHFYGDFTHGQWRAWIDKARSLAPQHLHLHAQVDAGRWVEEFSQYDAGWLHFFASRNEGELARADWDDLNIPARLATLVAAGVPLLQRSNRGHRVATQDLVRAHDIGLFFYDMPQLRAQLEDDERMAEVRANVHRVQQLFTFDHHAPALVEFFRAVRADVQARRQVFSEDLGTSWSRRAAAAGGALLTQPAPRAAE